MSILWILSLYTKDTSEKSNKKSVLDDDKYDVFFAYEYYLNLVIVC